MTTVDVTAVRVVIAIVSAAAFMGVPHLSVIIIVTSKHINGSK